MEKKALWESLGYCVVEFPYWLQPDEEVLAILFAGFECDFCQHFSDNHQGFMSDLASDVLPADFCVSGVKRFNRELSEQTVNTICRVVWSLKRKAEKLGETAVFPGEVVGDGLDETGIIYKDGLEFWGWIIHQMSEDEEEKIGRMII